MLTATMNHPILLTEAEAAACLRICARSLRKARADGKLHYILIGRSVRYSIEDIDLFIATSRKVQIPRTGACKARKRRLTPTEIIPFRSAPA